MATTFKVTIRTDQQNEAGKHAVRIRMTKHRKVSYYQTGIFLKYDTDKRKSDWNEEGTYEKANWVTSRHRDYGDLNARIKAIVKRFRDLDTNYPTYTAQQLRDAYDKPESAVEKKGFIAFAKELIKRKEIRGQYQTANSNQTALKAFERFWGTKPDNPDLLTAATVSLFIDQLRAEKGVRKQGKQAYAESSINLFFSFYTVVFRQAILEGWISPRPNPFDVPALTVLKTQKARPSQDLMYRLMELEDISEHQRHARNLFLMQFFLHGSRISEAFLLKWSDIGPTHVSYLPKKKAKRIKYVARHESMEWVLEQYPRDRKYVFPYFTEEDERLTGYDLVKRTNSITTVVNYFLHSIATLLGIPPLSSHMQRRTFADAVWSETNNMRDVQEALGHATMANSENYMADLGHLVKDKLTRAFYRKPQGNARETNPENPGTPHVQD